MRTPVDPEVKYGHLKAKVPWAVCDKCGWLWPERVLNFRDGLKVCPNHSTYLKSSRMVTEEGQKALRRNRPRDELKARRWPTPSEMAGVSGVFGIAPITLRRGGASVPWVLRGRNLSLSDAFAFSSTHITLTAPTSFTAIDPETKGNFATLTVGADNTTPSGSYDLLVNGDPYKGQITVTA